MKPYGWTWVVLGVGVVAAAAVESLARAEGLAGLDAKLNATGRIGLYAPTVSGIAPPSGGAETRETRNAAPALGRIDAEAAAREAHPTPGLGEDELMRTDGAVASCRIEIARRRQVPPARITAGTVRVRFSVDKSGRVHDAEAVATADTDLDVAACAKRVLSEWEFRKRARPATDVERTYSFADSPHAAARKTGRD